MSLINREALMKELGIAMDCSACEHDATPLCIWKPNVVDICEAITTAPTIELEPHWIPVSERLPDDEQFVLVTYKTTDRIHVCQYHEDGSRNQWYSLNDMCRAHNNVVLAWMPLPEPYREGEQE